MNMLRTLTLKVELFAGADIRDAACDLCELANRIGVMTETDFNSVKLWARPGDNPVKLVEAYRKAMKSGSTHKIAQARDAG